MEFKAGMEKVDFEAINSMLNQFSMGTQFQEKMERDSEQTNKFVEEMIKKLDHLPTDETYERVVDEYIEKLIKNKDLSRTFIHIDMDAFYAYVEEMDNPHLKGLPIAVGTMDMLVTSNYKAREYGVRSGIPGLIAMKLCPQLEILPSRMDRYREVSTVIRAIFYKFDVNYVSPSLDEGCLDITKYLESNHDQTPLDVASQLQEEIYEATGLTSSMGIAFSPLLAKISSEVNKPNGYFYLESNYEECLKYISNVPIKKIPGIGKVRQKLFETLGIQTVEDILNYKNELYFILADKHKEILFKHALGIPIFPTPNLYKLQKKKTMISKEKNCKELYDEKDLNLLMTEIYNYAINTLKSENKLALGMIVKIQDYSFNVQNFTFSLNQNSENTPIIDEDGYVIEQSSSSPLCNIDSTQVIVDLNVIDKDNTTDSSPISSPISSPVSSPIKKETKKRKSTTPTKNKISFKDNTEKIWELFKQTVNSIKFQDIKLVGLKLVNLIQDSESVQQ